MAIPEYGSLLPSDYQALGLKAGLEVHQQLLTDKKLFCRCPAGLYSEDYDAEILRHMRPTLSELGEYDGTALMEFRTRKEIVYRLNRDTVCTYEMDDAPPFGLNDQALDHALEIALLLNTNIVGELHVTRKQYLDGSIPTGFQRTSIIGTDGHIFLNGKRIGIRQLALEEDACREVSDQGHLRIYLTDRLSMPLIEAVTEPELYTPCEVAQACQCIRELTRSSGRVRRGHGRGRQDVNVSIRGGTRVEIKGVPRIPLIPALVHYEAFRQKALLELRDELLSAGLTPERFEAYSADITPLLSRTEYPPIKESLEKGLEAVAILLPGFANHLAKVTQPGRAFAAELADRIRVVACIDSVPNMIFRAMLAPSIEPSLWLKIERKLKATPQDGLVLLWGPSQDLQTAVQEIENRCREALIGVPPETRQMLGDGLAGITGFERVLPGPDRMYPDTDLPPVPIADQRVQSARSRIDDPPWVLLEKYLEQGLDRSLAKRLISSPLRKSIEQLWQRHPGLNQTKIARLGLDRVKGLRRKGFKREALEPHLLAEVIRTVASEEVADEAFEALVLWLAQHPQSNVSEAIIALKLTPLSQAQLKHHIIATLTATASRGPAEGQARWRFVMGAIMHPIRGRVRGADAAQLLAQKLD